jgi:hypothetical protein
MANNVTVTPAAAKMVYASGSTDFITVSGNVSGSSSPSYGVGGLHVTSDQTNSFGVFIHNKKAGGGNQYAKLELASEDDNLMVYHTWDNSAGGLGAQRFTQTVGETRTIFEGRSASNQLYLASGGNVGIGTVPAQTLHVEGTLRTSGKATFMAGTLPTNNGIRVNDTIELPQQAGDPTYVANAGVVWVKSTSPTTLWFTASDGTDTDLTAGGGGTFGGSVSDTYIPIATAADTLGNFMPAYVENTNMIMGVTPTSITTDADGNTAYGHLAGQSMTTGDNNVLGGYRAGISLTTGLANVFLGASAGYAATTSSYNNFIGYNAGAVGTRGNQNVGIGYYAMSKNQGANNVAIGHNTMEGETGADNDYTVAIGAYALRNISGTATRNTAVGYGAIQGASTGLTNAAQYNTAIGCSSMGALTGGYSNVAVGRNTLASITTGYDNTAVGALAGETLTTGYYNTYIGKSAGSGATTAAHSNVGIGLSALSSAHGANNIAIGRGALSNTTDANQVAIGSSALEANTSGEKNTAVGYQVLALNTTGNYNTAMGHHALYNNVDGAHNTAIGYRALHSLEPANQGGQNTAIGSQAGYKTSTGHTNVYVGYLAGYELLGGERNVLIGHEVGRNATSLNYSTIIGNAAGYNVSGASEVVYIGRNAGYHVTGNDNTFIGTSAGIGQAAATHATQGSVAIGKNAMYYNSTTNYNVAVGESALIGASSDPWMTGDYNTAVGRQSLADTSSGYGNVAMGYLAGKGVTTGYNNVFIGLQAGQYNAGGSSNTIVGYLSGRNNTGHYNTMLGYDSGITQTASSRNTFLGYGAGKDYVQTGDNKNTAVGMYAMTDIQSGSNNTALGYQALAGVNGSDNDYNVAVGYQALFATNGGDNNTAIGYQALTASTTAHSNVAIGYQALDSTTAGSENVAIGAYAGQALVGTTSSVYGGFSVFVGHTAGFQITGNVSYGGNTMVGHAAGYSATGADRSTGIGGSALYYADGAKYNTAVGRVAGAYAKGTGSTHVGDSSGYRISGNYNVSVGYGALSGASTGTGYGTAAENVAIGRDSLANVTSAGANVAIGYNAGNAHTTGDDNVYIGTSAGKASTTANGNVAIGKDAMKIGAQTSSEGQNTVVGYAGYVDGTGLRNVVLGYRAAYTATSANSNVNIGYEAGQKNTTGDSNVFIGNKAGPSSTSTDSNKLYINNDEGTPLIGGDFSAGEVTINASSKSITLDPYFVVSGDNQYSMISGSEGLALYGGNSYTDIWIDGQNSRQLRLRSVASDGSFDAGSFLEVFPSSVGATGDATANIRASSGDLYLYSVGSNNIALDSHHNLQFFFDNEYNMYSAADGNTRFTIRAASVAGMEFDGSSKIAFKNAASTKMTLDTANGRLGIGTTAPQQSLHVEGGFRFRDGNSSSQRLEGYGQNDNFMLVVSGSDALGLAGGTPGVRFNDASANTHLTVKPRADGAGGTTSALLSGANSAGLYFATQSGTRLELTGNHIIKTGQTIDNMLPYNTAAVHTATTATQVYQIEAQANPGQAGVTHTVTLNLPNGNVGGERFTVTCIAIGSFKPGTGNLTGEVVLGGTFINGTNLLSPTVSTITGATAAGQSVMQVKTFEFTWVASQFNPSGIGGWVYTYNTM